MKDRSPLLLGVIVALTLLAVYLNLGLVVKGFEHSTTVLRFLSWQGEDLTQRSLELKEGLDLQGGLQVLLQGDIRGGSGADNLQQAARIIRDRVDALGVTEPMIQTQGEDKIVVELPGVKDPDLAIRTIGETALLEFIYSGESFLSEGDEVATTHSVSQTLFANLPESQQKPYLGFVPSDDEEPSAGAVVTPTATLTTTPVLTPTAVVTATGAVTGTGAITDTAGAAGEAARDLGATAGLTATEGVTTSEAVTTTAGLTPTGVPTGEATTTGTADAATDATKGTEETIYPTVLTGADLRSASVGLDPVTSEIIVNFQLTSEGGRRLQEFTRNHHDDAETGKKEVMPIVLDGKVISSPSVRTEIGGGQGTITGRYTRPEAEAFIAQLNSGALPIELKVVGQTLIGPTLGRQSVNMAVTGGILGMVMVMIFMLLYYRLPGLLADIALILYALLTLSLFRLIPVTLTLAGIAGFVLSVGMAVDANILIFERMKEELRAGRRLGAAMDVGFSRAWPSIRDSNIATLITCTILFWFGNQFGASVVKGFAITLSLGVLCSMFTAIVVSRSLLKITHHYFIHEDVSRLPLDTPRLRSLFGF